MPKLPKVIKRQIFFRALQNIDGVSIEGASLINTNNGARTRVKGGNDDIDQRRMRDILTALGISVSNLNL